MKKKIVLIIVFCLCFSFNIADIHNSTMLYGGSSKDICILKLRIKQYYIDQGTDINAAAGYLLSQDKDKGNWDDINYSDQSVTVWQPLYHLSRILQMAVSYQTPSSAHYKSEQMREGICKGLDFWYKRKPSSKNWWQNMIGQQTKLGPILILMQDELPKELVDTGVAYFYAPDGLNSQETGQNLVWYASEQIIKGCLIGSDYEISCGVNAIEREIRFTKQSEDGIQRDYSFHQHGPQLYNGGYGLRFVNDTSLWATFLKDTKYAFEQETIEMLSDLLLNGTRWMVRGTMLDYGAQGREVARKAGDRAKELIPACNRMALLNPARKKEFGDFKNHIANPGNSYNVEGNKYFWNSDFIVHQRKDYYTSVKMVSARTVGAESGVGENLKGRWQSLGTNYIIRRGDEYKDIFPVWDWEHIPGVTAPYRIGQMYLKQIQSERFVGGVSDSFYGATAMVFDRLSTRGKKSWFFFDDEYVALGAGINSLDDAPINTTINQCLLTGDVIADGSNVLLGEHNISSNAWIYHDGIGYVFPVKASVMVKTGPQTGSWHSINAAYRDDIVTKSVFTLWLNHGIKPNNGNYQYIIVPGISANRLSAYVNNIPVSILANTPELQAVRYNAKKITGAVFYQPGMLNAGDGLVVKVDKPCMVLIIEKGQKIEITVSNPVAEPAQLFVYLTLSGKEEKLLFNLPGEDLGGSSQVKTIVL